MHFYLFLIYIKAYRALKMKNEDYVKELKRAEIEIGNARKLGFEYEQLQKVHQSDSEKFLDLQRETQQIGKYRDTVKNQQELIQKLESLLNRTMAENERQKDGLLELEQLRTENMKLQKELKDIVVNATPGVIGKGNIELEKYKKEVKKLEKIVLSLREELNSKRPISAEKKHIENEVLELEVKFHKAVSRVRSLEDEIQENAKRYAQEIARLKMLLSEKESVIETLRLENAF